VLNLHSALNNKYASLVQCSVFVGFSGSLKKANDILFSEEFAGKSKSSELTTGVEIGVGVGDGGNGVLEANSCSGVRLRESASDATTFLAKTKY
jgi:hypothetical protein